ncbi:Predicted oxidoreductase, contains short-chain dehydrogenase (SDR) and DUF2520 domains [Pedobacter westerhofensis]|uniref:Predicted oxidoreductase, contains short-chain dehydrogenase (SDR) and DUF2520 domains n=1 Tax=Pedobacter westerhofensis TaxID=425512 RepID=A0A521FP43_9SPHI|nr:Rossmann-like and DUF2520 domain-containing protein [Pedobacter westerhofensis]SMO97973.1 Predicted oxidoreductase, contains short-chain dehydrogenase (SDR) and DUF2520 domains [Pedobacter westerhofensis]
MNIVCIGSGNVATHLAIAFKAMGAEILQVWSQDSKNAEILAALTKAKPVMHWEDIDRSADLYIIAVKDDAIPAVALHLKGVKGILVHTSGATSISVLEGAGSGYGVLYPLQTFSKTKAVDLTNVPFCIEADRPGTLEKISAIAHLLSRQVAEVSSDQRKILHLAAVFACNFTNHLYQLSSLLLEQHHLKFDLLKPLITETAQKIQNAVPAEVQTGPAVRDDQETMKKHLQLLQGSPELQQIYELLSNSIKKTHL